MAKWAVRAAIWIWVGYWLVQIFIGDLGASPALKLNHEFGTIALVLLTVNLVLGALLSLLKPAPKAIRYWLSERRFWGVSAAMVLLIHVLFYFINEGFEFKAVTQIYTKTYLIFASLALLIIQTLALTSNNYSVRKLGGKKWKRLHRSVYAVQLLLIGHLLLIEKADLIKYSVWLGALLALQVLRFAWAAYRKKPLKT